MLSFFAFLDAAASDENLALDYTGNAKSCRNYEIHQRLATYNMNGPLTTPVQIHVRLEENDATCVALLYFDYQAKGVAIPYELYRLVLQTPTNQTKKYF